MRGWVGARKSWGRVNQNQNILYEKNQISIAKIKKECYHKSQVLQLVNIQNYFPEPDTNHQNLHAWTTFVVREVTIQLRTEVSPSR